MSDDNAFQRSKLTNKYYEKVAKSAAGSGVCPKFEYFMAGFGYVDRTDPDNPILLDIPATITEIPNVFYRGLVTAEYSNGQTVCCCEIPVGAVSTKTKYNLIGIFDQEDDLVAVCSILPDWITPTESDKTYPTLTFPIETE